MEKVITRTNSNVDNNVSCIYILKWSIKTKENIKNTLKTTQKRKETNENKFFSNFKHIYQEWNKYIISSIKTNAFL
jgi:hypothetical protein